MKRPRNSNISGTTTTATATEGLKRRLRLFNRSIHARDTVRRRVGRRQVFKTVPQRAAICQPYLRRGAE